MLINRVCFATLFFFILNIAVAPASNTNQHPKERLEELRKRLPDVLNGWVKEDGNVTWLTGGPNKMTCQPELRLLRRISPHRAKAIILFAALLGDQHYRPYDKLLTVFLTYQDGFWTTERFEINCEDDHVACRKSFAFLMLAIDESADKKKGNRPGSLD